MKYPTLPDSIPCGNEVNLGKFHRSYLRHYGDTACIAMGKVISELNYTTLFKRRPGRDWTTEQRAYNLAPIPRSTYVWRTAFRRLKVFRIMKMPYV